MTEITNEELLNVIDLDHGMNFDVYIACQICNEIFQTELELEDHAHIHDREYGCVGCIKVFKTNEELLEHVYLEHGTNLDISIADLDSSEFETVCQICNEIFPTQLELEDHAAKHDREYSCLNCNKVFKTNEELLEHVDLDHLTTFDISIPDLESSLLAAMMVPSIQTSPSCPICEEPFLTDLELEEHIVSHDTLRWICCLCDEGFTNSEEQEEHVRLNHRNNLDTSMSFLIRDMGESVSNVDSVIGYHENPLLESTAVHNHPACNEYCTGVHDDDQSNSYAKCAEPEFESSTDFHLILEETLNEELEIDNPKKRKCDEEPLKVVFVGKLLKDKMMYNIPAKKKRKCNKW